MRCAGRCGERTERCRWQRKRSERVAAVKILSVRRKAAQKFWAPQQDHRPLRRFGKKVSAWNLPVTASPCQPPLGKGPVKTGVTDCHSRCAHRLRNDRVFTRGAVCGGTHGSRPTHFMGRGGDTGRCRHRPLQPNIRTTKKDRREAVFFLHISIMIICAFSLRHGAGRTSPAPPPGSPARPGPGRYRTRPSPQG